VTQRADFFINEFIVVCSTQFKSQISQKVHPDTIRTALASVKLDDVLVVEEVHQVFKQCYGVKHWLLAPEDGTRGVLRAALQLYEAPLRQILVEMTDITLEAAKLAMKSSAKAASRAQGGMKKSSLADDAVRHLLLDQAENLVEQWRDQTWEQLRRNLHAEAEFPAPERFAKLKSRLQELLGAEAAKQAARQNEVYKRMLLDTLHQLQNTNVNSKSPLPLVHPSLPPTSTKTAAVIKKEEPPSWSEFFMGWLLKQNRHGLWQRRWFALSLRQQRFWYFANPEEQPARASGDLVGAKIVSLLEQQEDEYYDGEGETKQQKTFKIVFRGGDIPITGQNQVRALSIPPEAQKAAEALTGQKTKTLTTELILRATTVSSKNQWCEMLNRAIIGIPEEPKAMEAAPAAAAVQNISVEHAPIVGPDPFVEDKDDSTRVGRKISTKVFQNAKEEKKNNKKNNKNTSKKTSAVSVSSSEADDEKDSPTFSENNTEEEDEEEEESDEAREEREMALFEEIAAQAEYTATAEEQAVLECVSLAVREYIVDALGYLTEQASRIIADGMLPLTRAEELHSKLLRVLITGREGGGAVVGWAAAEGGFDSDDEA
jgi:PH domain